MTSPPLSPSRTVVTSFTPRKPGGQDDSTNPFEEGDWVLRLAVPPRSSTTLSCALSNGQVQVYDQQRLHLVTTFANIPLVTDLVYGPDQCLVSTSNDGSLTVHDLRQSIVAVKSRLPSGQAALSVALGYDGYLAAVASQKGKIHFLDLRSSLPLVGSYVDSHSDDVTTVEFQPSSPLLVTGAEDGLACVFDTTQSTEERALRMVFNTGTPLRRAGFCGTSESVWCLTGSETASLWSTRTGECLYDSTFNLRENLRQGLGDDMDIDYLIDAHWDTNAQELFLSAGNGHGDAAIFRLTPSWQWEGAHRMIGGHRGVIRAAQHLSSSVLVTAGEDARICEWNCFGPQAHSATGSSPTSVRSTALQKSNVTMGATTGGGPLRRPRHRQSAAPY